MIATYLRNLLLNQAILIAALAAFLLLPHLVVQFAERCVRPWIEDSPLKSLILIGLLLYLIWLLAKMYG
jgi:hypothetical protein